MPDLDLNTYTKLDLKLAQFDLKLTKLVLEMTKIAPPNVSQQCDSEGVRQFFQQLESLCEEKVPGKLLAFVGLGSKTQRRGISHNGLG